MRFKVYYDATIGKSFPDGEVAKAVAKFISADKGECIVSNSLFINAMRVAIIKDEVSYEDVVFVFEGEEIYPDKNARFEYWPDGFCDHLDKQLLILLGWRK